MANLKLHNQGGEGADKKHLTADELVEFLGLATRSVDGLAPVSTLYQGAWVRAPWGSYSSGRAGMRAYDDNWFYVHIGLRWMRAPLEDF